MSTTQDYKAGAILIVFHNGEKRRMKVSFCQPFTIWGNLWVERKQDWGEALYHKEANDVIALEKP